MEAAAHLRRALAAVERISDLPDAAKLELPIQLSLGVALTASEGFAGFERPREVEGVETAGDPHLSIRSLFDGDAPVAAPGKRTEPYA